MVQVAPQLLLDVTGLLQWYGFFRHPTGVQRLTEHLLTSSPVQTLKTKRFIARGFGGEHFFEVEPDILLPLCAPETRQDAIPRVRALLAASIRLGSRAALLADLTYSHLPYIACGIGHLESLIERWFAASSHTFRPIPLSPISGISPNDVLVNFGDYWSHRTYVEALLKFRTSERLRLVTLLHDVFVVEHPEWMNRKAAMAMATQLGRLSPNVDQWLTTSEYVCDSARRYLTKIGVSAPRIEVLPMGQGRVGPRAYGPSIGQDVLDKYGLLGKEYFIHVGTVEPRKNLELLLDAITELSARDKNVPHCLLVGRAGWNSSRLIKRLRGGEFQHGEVSWLQGISDLELGVLYDNAIFSVLPSVAEGWGLPIRESLAHGLPCIATSAGGSVEAGKGLVEMFDPTLKDDLVSKLSRWIDDRDELARVRAKVRLPGARGEDCWDITGEAFLAATLGKTSS